MSDRSRSWEEYRLEWGTRKSSKYQKCSIIDLGAGKDTSINGNKNINTVWMSLRIGLDYISHKVLWWWWFSHKSCLTLVTS